MRAYLLRLDADVRLRVAKGVEGNGDDGRGARLALEALAQLLVGDGQHPAVRMVDDHELLGSDPSGVSDDVRVARREPQHRLQRHPRVHARDDGEPSSRRPREVPQPELAHICLVERSGHGVFV